MVMASIGAQSGFARRLDKYTSWLAWYLLHNILFSNTFCNIHICDPHAYDCVYGYVLEKATCLVYMPLMDIDFMTALGLYNPPSPDAKRESPKTWTSRGSTPAKFDCKYESLQELRTAASPKQSTIIQATYGGQTWFHTYGDPQNINGDREALL